MIDVKKLRENPAPYYESCEIRGYGKDIIDKFLDLDNQWKDALKKRNVLNHERNVLSREVSSLIKRGTDASQILSKVRELKNEIAQVEDSLRRLEIKREEAASAIPNLLHSSVPRCKGDENNKLVRYYGTARVFSEDIAYFKKNSGGSNDYDMLGKRPLSHVDLEAKLGLVDLKRAGKIAGSRFYFLKDRLLKLELALVNFAVDFLSERGFTIVEPPFMINRRSLEGSTDMETFNDAIYKVENEDLYLIATSEHPIASMLQDEILNEDELPIRVGGLSPCFRKEAGSHGKDTKGIFRVHQFYKVEQFVFCKEDDSWDFLEEILANAEEIYKILQIPYRVVNVCSGELSVLNAKKYDIEGWFPSQGKFRELVSASNNTDFQGRSLSIRWRSSDGNKIVNTLNSTAIATTRTMVAIMENYQLEDGSGFRIPKALWPYTGFESIALDDQS